MIASLVRSWAQHIYLTATFTMLWSWVNPSLITVQCLSYNIKKIPPVRYHNHPTPMLQLGKRSLMGQFCLRHAKIGCVRASFKTSSLPPPAPVTNYLAGYLCRLLKGEGFTQDICQIPPVPTARMPHLGDSSTQEKKAAWCLKAGLGAKIILKKSVL